MNIPIAMIAAVARNGVIGADGGIPWRIPSDMAFFKRTTMGKPMVMGRKQFESVGRPLPGRTNIVVSRRPEFFHEGVVIFSDLGEALEHAREIAAETGAGEVMVIGGGEIYRAAMPFAERLYISHVDLDPEGDTTFPEISLAEWEVAQRHEMPQDPRDSAPFRVVHYTRKGTPGR